MSPNLYEGGHVSGVSCVSPDRLALLPSLHFDHPDEAVVPGPAVVGGDGVQVHGDDGEVLVLDGVVKRGQPVLAPNRKQVNPVCSGAAARRLLL